MSEALAYLASARYFRPRSVNASIQGGSSGRSTLGGLKVEDGRTLEGLELVLQPACRVEGNVIGSDGAPVAGATVIALDEKGRRLTGWERETTDAAGHFAFESLPPVRATFCATKGMQSSGASTWVQISEGEPSKVDLALVNATLLFVQPVDAQGNGVQADVQVLDARGLDQGSLSDWNVQPSAPQPGHRFGPLAPGKYTVVVMLKDKPDVRQEVTLSGDPTQAFSVHVE